MNLEDIAGLVKILEESSLTEMTVKEGDFKITMSKLDHPAPPAPAGAPFGAGFVPAMPAGFGAPGMPGAVPQAGAPAAESGADTEEEDDTAYITSPIVGTFYAAPAPDAAPFVKVGDHVKDGQTVCILEAMKLMNEIQSDFDCEIEAVLVSNEQKVEYGQPLFRVKKL